MNPNLLLTIKRFNDMHCHFRLDDLMYEVVPQTARYARYGLAMPNTRPRAILTDKDVIWYRDQLEQVLVRMTPRPVFTPLMTIEIRDRTTPEMVTDAYRAGAIAGKVYPRGVTTNSDEGLGDFFSGSIWETFRAMQDIGMILLLHGELDRPRTLVTNREKAFLPTLRQLAVQFPRLKIVLEHASTVDALHTVSQLGNNVGASITAHHLCLTLNDVIGDGVRPHNACMPTPKDFIDRDALRSAATGQWPELIGRVWLGSDSAPHPREHKERAKGACGVYTAPVLPSVLVEVFEQEGRILHLDNFCADAATAFYGLPHHQEVIELVKAPWDVPNQYGSVVPFRAGTTLDWQLK